MQPFHVNKYKKMKKIFLIKTRCVCYAHLYLQLSDSLGKCLRTKLKITETSVFKRFPTIHTVLKLEV